MPRSLTIRYSFPPHGIPIRPLWVKDGDDDERLLEEMMTSPKAETGTTENRATADLDRRYGRIGISAVAAALTCKGEDKTSADTSHETQR